MPKRLAIELFHGRRTPNEHLQDWGEPGPIFLDMEAHLTYFSTLQLNQRSPDGWEVNHGFLDLKGDLIYYDGMYYGDLYTFLYDEDDRDHQTNFGPRIQTFDSKKAKIPEDPKPLPAFTTDDHENARTQGWDLINLDGK